MLEKKVAVIIYLQVEIKNMLIKVTAADATKKYKESLKNNFIDS
jgi:hypothetical protein